MNSRKLIFLMLTVIFVMSCQKDGEELQESELNYVLEDVRIISGSYTGCELYERMNELKLELSQEIDPKTGGAIYVIPETNYFDCSLMNEPFYIEQWNILADFTCGGKSSCPDNDFPLERDDDDE